MGAAIAKELLKKVLRQQIMICDNDSMVIAEAQRSGYKCSTEMTDILFNCHIIIAAASRQILGHAEFSQMMDGACVACVTSGDDQFKLDYLNGLIRVKKESLYITTYKRLDGASIHLACDGRSINFSIGSTPHPVLHAVLGSVLVYAYNCINNELSAPAPSSCISEFSSQRRLDTVIEEIYKSTFTESVLVRDNQNVSRDESIPQTKASFMAKLLEVLYYIFVAPIIFLLSPLLMLFMTFNIKLSLNLGGMLAFAGAGVKHYFTIKKAYKLLKQEHRKKVHVNSLIKARDNALNVATVINQSDLDAKSISATQQGNPPL